MTARKCHSASHGMTRLPVLLRTAPVWSFLLTNKWSHEEGMRTYLHNHFRGANTARLFTSAVSMLLTAVYCWGFVEAFLWVREMLPDAAGPEALLNGPSITSRVIFDFVVLGLLWHYLTPRKLYRYLSQGIQNLNFRRSRRPGDRRQVGKSAARLQPWWL